MILTSSEIRNTFFREKKKEWVYYVRNFPTSNFSKSLDFFFTHLVQQKTCAALRWSEEAADALAGDGSDTSSGKIMLDSL